MNIKKACMFLLASAICLNSTDKVQAAGMEVNQYTTMNIEKVTDEEFHEYHGISAKRKAVVNTALSAEGRIKYIWGDKPSQKGWDEEWDTGERGLDCSGFIQWVYWTTLDMQCDQGTSNLSSFGREITHDELKPGDIGIIYDGGTYYMDSAGNRFVTKEEAVNSNIVNMVEEPDKNITSVINHCGIYVGKDDNGNEIWCHCRGGAYKTVVVDNFDKFTYYRRAIED